MADINLLPEDLRQKKKFKEPKHSPQEIEFTRVSKYQKMSKPYKTSGIILSSAESENKPIHLEEKKEKEEPLKKKKKKKKKGEPKQHVKFTQPDRVAKPSLFHKLSQLLAGKPKTKIKTVLPVTKETPAVPVAATLHPPAAGMQTPASDTPFGHVISVQNKKKKKPELIITDDKKKIPTRDQSFSVQKSRKFKKHDSAKKKSLLTRIKIWFAHIIAKHEAEEAHSNRATAQETPAHLRGVAVKEVPIFQKQSSYDAQKSGKRSEEKYTKTEKMKKGEKTIDLLNAVQPQQIPKPLRQQETPQQQSQHPEKIITPSLQIQKQDRLMTQPAALGETQRTKKAQKPHKPSWWERFIAWCKERQLKKRIRREQEARLEAKAKERQRQEREAQRQLQQHLSTRQNQMQQQLFAQQSHAQQPQPDASAHQHASNQPQQYGDLSREPAPESFQAQKQPSSLPPVTHPPDFGLPSMKAFPSLQSAVTVPQPITKTPVLKTEKKREKPPQKHKPMLVKMDIRDQFIDLWKKMKRIFVREDRPNRSQLVDVDLLKDEVTGGKNPSPELIKIAVYSSLVLISAVALWGFYFYQTKQVASLVPANQRQLDYLEKAVTDLKTKHIELQKSAEIIQTVESLISMRIDWIRFFEKIEFLTMKNVYYTSFSMNEALEVRLTARAQTNEDALTQIRIFQSATDFISEVRTQSYTLNKEEIVRTLAPVDVAPVRDEEGEARSFIQPVEQEAVIEIVTKSYIEFPVTLVLQPEWFEQSVTIER